MERFYDGDQDKLFSEARVVNPFNKPASNSVKIQRRTSNGMEECEICFMVLPYSVSVYTVDAKKPTTLNDLYLNCFIKKIIPSFRYPILF